MPNLSTNTSQVKITLSQELYAFLKSRADRLGLTLAAYVRNLVIDDIKDMDFPTFAMSEKREKIALNALEEHKKGKTKRIADVDKYLSEV
jgi:predicted DNA-binding protein